MIFIIYLICGLVYMLVFDFIARLIIKDQTKELRLRPMNFSQYHMFLFLFWPLRIIQDLIDEVKFRLR